LTPDCILEVVEGFYLLNTNDNLYSVLGINKDAKPTEIKEAYLYKVNILHGDRLQGMSERIRLKAEEDLKQVNQAYSVLSNAIKRQQYDAITNDLIVSIEPKKPQPNRKPKVGIFPQTVELKDALPYVNQKGSFFVRNTGGSCAKVLISEPPPWITSMKTTSLREGTKLPMQVHIEAQGIQWGKVYSSELVIRLDESEARVKIKLCMQQKPN
jgi:hypothetical protein